MHYIATASEPAFERPVVLVHGAGLSYRYMLPTAKRLADRFRVLVPDQPGFGKSFKPWRTLTFAEIADSLAAWMDALRLSSAAFLGNSVGCQVIVELAVRHPERVSRAILQGPTCDPEARTFPKQFQRWRLNRRQEHRRDKGSIVIRDYWECGPWRLYKTLRYAIDDPLETKLPKMTCPTLVVRGDADPIVSQEWAEEVARLLPHGRLCILEGGVAHTANFEAPDELVRAVIPFLEDDSQPSKKQRAGGAGPEASPLDGPQERNR